MLNLKRRIISKSIPLNYVYSKCNFSKNMFSGFLKGTKGYTDKSPTNKEVIDHNVKKCINPPTSPITTEEANLKENIQSILNNIDLENEEMMGRLKTENLKNKNNNIEENVEIFEVCEVTDSDLNTIEKESKNKDSGRSFKGYGLGRTENKSKEFPHGHDKI